MQHKQASDPEGKKNRSEAEVFEDIATLCSSPGYIHAIAYFCWRDNLIRYDQTLVADDVQSHYGQPNLIRTEISTLIGLMARAPIEIELPTPEVMQGYIDRTDVIMNELHHAMMASAFFEGKDWAALHAEGKTPFDQASTMREPIFYGGESAYDFQYEELTPLKYQADDTWISDNRGFVITDALTVAKVIRDGYMAKIASWRDVMLAKLPDEWTLLPLFIFKREDIVIESGLPEATVDAVLCAFRFAAYERNNSFTGVSEFNETNARPILHLGDGSYVLFQHYQLQESLYESPFFWMMADATYRPTATANRGDFTESYASERLGAVFGKARVLRNIDIYRGKNRYVEADALVIFGDHSVVVQAKSKRLTLEARKGNDQVLRDDFRKAVENAYEQALLCANALQNPAAFTFRDSEGAEVGISYPIRTVFPVCVLVDHYPALSFQGRQFLKVRATEAVRPPLITDVFTLDVLAEFLRTPIQFLNYLDLRAQAHDRLLVTNELVPFSYHLKNNLWLDPQYDMVNLGEDFTAHVDVAMTVRRRGASGNPEVEGVLTRYRGTSIGSLFDQIEEASIPELTGLGLWLLQLSGESGEGLVRALDAQARAAIRQRVTKDLSLPFAEQSSGLTIHLSELPDQVACEKLLRHCKLKKYELKASRWFGLILSPANCRIRHALVLDEPWEPSPAIEEILATLPRRQPVPLADAGDVSTKVGRNAACPCGSGLKYKKCCLPR